MAKLNGWNINGRPFSPKEYNNSYLKENSKMSYSQYLRLFAKELEREKKSKTPPKRIQHRTSTNSFFGGKDFFGGKGFFGGRW